MKFRIEKEVFKKFPNLVVAVPVILGFDNSKSKNEALNILRNEEDKLRKVFSLDSFFKDKRVVAYRDAFKEFGIDPDKRNPAHVALSKRILEGNSLPDINPIVNLYNALSIKYTTPFGGEDLDTLYGDFVLKFAQGNEKWTGIGNTKQKVMAKGDLIWVDDFDVSTPSLNWRQCDRTKLTEKSKNGYFIMDGFSDINKGSIEDAAKEFIELVTKYFGGKSEMHWIDKNNSEVEVLFESKNISSINLSKPVIESEPKKLVKQEYFGYQKQIADILDEVTVIKYPNVEFASNEHFGDYSTNVALKNKDLDPQEIAQKINDKKLSFTANVVGRFINFKLNSDVLIDNLIQIDSKKEGYGKSDVNKSKNLMFEFAHPNTHKAFHIGHLRNITTGECLSRLHEITGAKVVRANYQGDVGLHIAKALYGIKLQGFEEPKDVKKRAEYLGKVYAVGATKFEESDEAKEIVSEINQKIYDKSDAEINKLYETTRQWSLDYFDSIYKRVYTKFDRLYFESETAESGKQIALESLEKGILTKSDGAIIFEGSKHGLHDRVFISGKGIPTYEGKDLGLAKLQFAEYSPDLLIHIVGPEQAEYFKVIFKALEFIMPETKGREVHVPYGWVKLKEGKMSSRTGNVVLGEDILDTAKQNILDSYNVDEETAEKIAVGAVKYSFLKSGLNQEIAFDLKESISLDGNSGPYIQYTFARIQSVLAKAANAKLKIDNSLKIKNWKFEIEEENLLRKLSQFQEVIVTAAKTYSPNILCNYLYDLASKFNTLYNAHKIIGAENEDFRLLLSKSTAQVLKNGLNLLGISAPEKM